MEHRVENRKSWIRSDVSVLIALIAVILRADVSWTKPEPDASQATELSHGNSVGRVRFPTSCASAVQRQIEQGVALLHSFQYREAETTFDEVSKQDPACAVANWGKAMSLYEQLWAWPDARAFALGREDVEAAENQTAITPRERAYVEVARVFYQKGPECPQIARMKAFSGAWERLYRQFPDDNEAGAFYGLSLVALAEAGADETTNRKRAIAVLEPLFRSAPDDPGPAHYLIHAADTPELAPLGLDAARRYASIAPDSAHALHMPSHIFVRLGLWRESIESNRASAKVAAEATRAGHADMHYQVHAMDFLNYSYLQVGDEAAARQVIDELQSVVGASAQQISYYQADFRARAALELHRWKEAESLTAPSGLPRAQETTYWVRAIAEARSGDVTRAQGDLAKLEEIVAVLDQKSQTKGPASNANLVQEARAWIAFAQGKVDDAVRTLRATADSEEAERIESISMPAREMLADMLLESKRASEALHEYELTLQKTPNRFDALYGAAHAAESAGQPEDARNYFAKLVAVATPSADRPELQEARTYLAAR